MQVIYILRTYAKYDNYNTACCKAQILVENIFKITCLCIYLKMRKIQKFKRKLNKVSFRTY